MTETEQNTRMPAERQSQVAVQEAMDRRDNGGPTGH